MSKLAIKKELDSLIKDKMVFCPFETVFYLEGKFLALGKKNRIVYELNEIGKLLKKYPDIKVYAFNFNYVWSLERRDFEDAEFIATLPESIKTHKDLIILNCQTPELANEFIKLVQERKSTFYFPLTMPHEKDGKAVPGCSIIYQP